MEKIGILHVRLQFKSDIAKMHAKLDHDPDSQVVMEGWKASVAVGPRSATSNFAENVRKLEGNDGGTVTEAAESKNESEASDNEVTTTPQHKTSNGEGVKHDSTFGDDDSDLDDLDDEHGASKRK